MNDKINERHLCRSAAVYIRQSSLQQVRNNTESGRRQYALEGRARELGFATVLVIDEDLGVSGTGSRERPGFARLLAAVCNGDVGAVFALEASRLARNNRDWHHLIDLCVLTETVVVDAEGVYDPRLLNDRMLLGLKGTLSEFEIGVLRQRAQEAMRQKVQRGEVLTMVPIGYERSGRVGIEMSPDRQVQEAIYALFDRLEAMGTLRQVMLWYHEERLTFPRRRICQGVSAMEWSLPEYQHLLRIVRNPVYAGAFAYGRRRTMTSVVGGRSRKSAGRRVAMDEWQVLIRDHHAGYITWERYMKNLDMLKANSTRMHAVRAGAARAGSALLSGLLRCAKCGLKLTVGYRGGPGANARYQCLEGIRERGKPVCQCFAAFRVDRAVEAEILKVCQPLAVEASLQAVHQKRGEVERKRRLLEVALEKARYDVERARRQYDAVDPLNRLVASELEARWNAALATAAEAEARLSGMLEDEKPLSAQQRRRILALGADIQQTWNDPGAPMEIKKRIARILIREVIADVKQEDDVIDLVVHWAGGAHTRLQVPKNKVGRNKNAASPETVALVRELAQGWSDRYIAQMLNRLGCRTGWGNGWSETRVKSFRGQHRIPVFSAGMVRPWLTMREVAAELGMSAGAVKTLILQGKLPARQIVSGLPWMIERACLASPGVIGRVRALKSGRRGPREEPGQIVIPLA